MNIFLDLLTPSRVTQYMIPAGNKGHIQLDNLLLAKFQGLYKGRTGRTWNNAPKPATLRSCQQPTFSVAEEGGTVHTGLLEVGPKK